MATQNPSKLAEKVASAAAELYHAILDTASVGIITVDDTDLIVYANGEACRMWEYEPGELIGNPITLLLPSLPEPEGEETRAKGLLTHLVDHNIDVEGRSRSGKRVRVALSARETVVGGTTLFTAAVQDISERLQYEEALVRAREEAEETARVRTALVTNIGHEIRTPLTGIRGFAKVLIEEGEGEQREFAELIEQNSRRLLDTLNSVLEMARLEASATRSPASTFDLVETLRSVAKVMAHVGGKESVQLLIEASHHTITVHADQESLYSILYNLVGNAIKFTPSGTVTAAVNAEADHVRIDVEDTGIGISEEFLSRIFDDFTQESTGLTRDFEGSGLGLAITHRAVRALGGDISVVSERGQGSRFTVTLPLACEASGEPVTERFT